MDANDVGRYIKRYNGEFLKNSLTTTSIDYNNLKSFKSKKIRLQVNDDLHFVSYDVLTKNTTTGEYEDVDWVNADNYDHDDFIYQTDLDELLKIVITELTYLTSYYLSPISYNPTLFSLQAYQKTCGVVKAIMTQNCFNAEYDSLKNLVNFIIDHFLNNNDLIYTKTVGHTLSTIKYDQLKIN